MIVQEDENESIYIIFTCFIDIVNGLKALRKDIPNIELVNTILHSLSRSEEPKVTVTLEAKDLTKLESTNS